MQITNPLRFLITLVVLGTIISICTGIDPYTGENLHTPERTRVNKAKTPSCNGEQNTGTAIASQIIYEKLTFYNVHKAGYIYPEVKRFQEILTVTGDGCNTVNLTQAKAFAEKRQSLGLGVPMEAEPVWSPDRTKIAFTSSQGTYYDDTVANIERDPAGRKVIVVKDAVFSSTSEVENISLEELIDKRLSYGSQPDWSPDGKKLVFISSDKANNSDIFIMNGDGTNKTRITETLDNETDPDWSPDGTKIAFALSDPNVNWGGGQRFYSLESDIYVMGADGSNVIRLTNFKAEDYLTELEFAVLKQSSPRWGCCNGHSYAPSWSPDGSKIAFVLDTTIKDQPDFTPGFMDHLGTDVISGITSGIYIMDSDGTNLALLTEAEAAPHKQLSGGGQPSKSLSGPTWSPDGSMIAFEDMGDIYTIKIDGTNRMNITKTDEYESYPDWSS